MTTTLFNIIRSELIKKGFNEFIDDEGNLVYFNEEDQFMSKIFKYDMDISDIMNDLFAGLGLDEKEHDEHFKKSFLYRFVNRKINRQTVESFKMELLSIFTSNSDYINRIYKDMDKYLTRNSVTDQENNQLTDGKTISDNRSAFADLPQSTANLDVESSIMNYATDNTISKNKQVNLQETDGKTITEHKTYQLDELLKSNGILEEVFNKFDKKCFLQVW